MFMNRENKDIKNVSPVVVEAPMGTFIGLHNNLFRLGLEAIA